MPHPGIQEGHVWGVIFHLEITPDDTKRWANAYPDEPAVIGKTVVQVIKECESTEKDMSRLASLLIDNFLRQAS